MNIQILNPVEHPHWDDMLLSADRATFFHSSAWARVLSESYGYIPLYFTIIENGKLFGLIPVMEIKSFLTGRRGVSLPFTDMCDPLAEDPEAFEALLKKAAEYGRQARWKYIEMRGGGTFQSHQPASAEHFVHCLDLSADEAGVCSNFKPNIRRNIRKAEKEGISVALERSRESVNVFYRLHCGTRRHHGLPPQPWSFFKKIHEHVIAAGKGFVALARYQNRWVAGAVYALYRDQAIYKYGASDRGLQHLRPNNLVMWEAIRWCCRNGIRALGFGRTEPENEGLLQFKRGWGAVEGRLQYHQLDLRSNRFVGETAGPNTSYAAFKTLPLPMLRLAGHLLYRHVG
jgi:CelD/BcsL family acetyltransferase involved in cellulose biosynthesis